MNIAHSVIAGPPPASAEPEVQGGDRPVIDFRTSPERYRHWHLGVDGEVAWLRMDVDEAGALVPGQVLKLNSYDLGVDIELADAVDRLRFEHPEVRAVVLTSAKPQIFCAGANIAMLAAASHHHKVNFCKFTNETRAAIEDASLHSGQRWLAALNGPAAGGGFELALACDHILLVDDNSSTVSLPEVPLLAVLPGTGGLTRLVDKRHVRHDHADILCTTAEGVRGGRALDWGLIDELAPRSRFETAARERAVAMAGTSERTSSGPGVALTPLARRLEADSIGYSTVGVVIDRGLRTATLTVTGPETPPPADASAALAEGAGFWPLRMSRELDDALLHLRLNEPEIGTLVLTTTGDGELVAAYDGLLDRHRVDDWFIRESVLHIARTLRRLDLSARSLVALVAPGSCAAGTLAELVLAADRSVMLSAERQDSARTAVMRLTAMNAGPLTMSHGWTRLQSHFAGRADRVSAALARMNEPLDADTSAELGLVTSTPDEIDWDDEVRLLLEERASFSPDALTAMEASLRFPGPETMDSKVFGRLTAWQNWVFQRPNAIGADGALRRYGSGQRARYDVTRV